MEAQTTTTTQTTTRPLIVTRHVGMIRWLLRRGIEGDLALRATAEGVAGRDVIGNLPTPLAALAKSCTFIHMPGLTAADRGVELDADAMDARGARLVRFEAVRAADGDDAVVALGGKPVAVAEPVAVGLPEDPDADLAGDEDDDEDGVEPNDVDPDDDN